MKSMSKRRWYLFRFIILIQCKKTLLCFKTSFVGLKKIVFFFESFYEVVLLLIQFFLARGCFGSCRVVQCLVWFEVFLFICWFFQWLDEIQSRIFFPVVFFLWDFLCLVSLRWGRFFCWMNWIVCWLSCRRICFFFYSNFF